MKKILIFLILGGMLAGCYPEFRNDYAYTTVAFSPVTGGLSTVGELGRSIVKDEGLRLYAGVYLGGRLSNPQDEWVKFTIDPTLLAIDTALRLMPADYYTLSSPDKFLIPAGEFIGKIEITIDSAKFVADPRSVNYQYAIPFRLTETSADSILSTRKTQLLVVKYINHYEGFYDNIGTFTTFDASGVQINAGTTKSVIEAKTLFLDSTITDGINYMNGVNFRMKTVVRSDKTVFFKKIPNLPAILINIAVFPTTTVSTSYVSSWEKLEAIRDGYTPANSRDKTGGAYGNWNSANIERWVQYDFPQCPVSKAEVYWWTDGGGIQFPDYCKFEYWDIATSTWLPVSNPVGLGVLGDKFNVTTWDPVITSKIRMYSKSSVQSVGILEWRLWGVPPPVKLEQAPVEDVIPEGTNTYDEATDTYTLNYRIIYEDLDYYTIVSTKMKWRNRVRDKVNEWRR